MLVTQNYLNKTREEMVKEVRLLREKKGQEKKVFELINEAFVSGHEFIIDLFWEEILTLQHIIMSEESKPVGERNKKLIEKNLKKWESTLSEAKFYIKKYELTRWLSRMYRFQGRFYDYKGLYKKSIPAYKKAIKYSKKDPEYVEEKVPRYLELEAFLSYALLMNGKTKKGLKMAKNVYKRFDKSREGKELKKNDYPTWAVWKSGVVIRTINALMGKSELFDKKEMLSWLKEVEKEVKSEVVSEKWGGKVDFSFRKDEIKKLKNELI